MIRIKAYYLDKPLENKEDLENKDSFWFQKKSLLKGGLRGFLLESPENFSTKEWYNKILDKELVEFYIEKSGVYKLANLDLNEGELYFEKSESPVYLKKRIFVDISFDTYFQDGILKALIDKFQNNFTNQLEIGTIESFTKGKGSIKLDDAILSNIRNALIFVADITPIAEKNVFSDKPKWIANSNVMLELGYAIAVKDKSNIIITYDKEKTEQNIDTPFDIQSYKNIPYHSTNNDYANLLSEIEQIIKRMGLKI